MSTDGETATPGETAFGAPVRGIIVRYWAGARAAAGVESDVIVTSGPLSLVDVRSRAAMLHPNTRLAAVLSVCAVLVGEEPVSSADPATVQIPPGAVVEFLPPFAGG